MGNWRRWVGGIVLGMILALVIPVSAQGPYSAQIQAAIRRLLSSNQTITGTWTFSTPPIGAGSIGGSIAAGQVAVGSGVDTIGGSSALTFSGGTLTGNAAKIIFGVVPPTATVSNPFSVAGDDTLTNSAHLEYLITARTAGPSSYGEFNTGTAIYATINPSGADPAYNIYAANLIQNSTIGSAVVYETYGQIVNTNFSNSAGAGTSLIEGIASSTNVSADAYFVSGIYSSTATLSAANVGTLNGQYSNVLIRGTSTVTNVSNFYADAIKTGSASATNWFGFYISALGGIAVNPYSFWSDEQGVFRIKSDNTFDSVYQAIPALYNPQFTKYTPGAANYERVVMGQWNGNVAEIGTEKGGTGTLRTLRLISADVTLPALTNGSALKTDTTTAHTALFQAYDANDAVYRTFGTATNGNTPSWDWSAPAGGSLTGNFTTLQVGSVSLLPALTGTTGSIGGGLLSVACTSGTATVTGATTDMGLVATPAAYPGDGVYWEAYRSNSNEVTVKVCTVAAVTPTATTYTVRAVQ